MKTKTLSILLLTTVMTVGSQQAFARDHGGGGHHERHRDGDDRHHRDWDRDWDHRGGRGFDGWGSFLGGFAAGTALDAITGAPYERYPAYDPFFDAPRTYIENPCIIGVERLGRRYFVGNDHPDYIFLSRSSHVCFGSVDQAARNGYTSGRNIRFY